MLISPSGSDENDGSPGAPFQTLQRARDAMRASGTRRAFLADGHYTLAKTLQLDRRDSGVALLACPGAAPELDGREAGLGTMIRMLGANRVLIQGIGFVGGKGDASAVLVQNASGERIERNWFRDNGAAITLAGSRDAEVCGNRIVDPAVSGVEVKDGGENVLIANNQIEGVDAPATHGGGVFVHGASRTVIAQNRVEKTRGAGIVVSNWDDQTINIGTVIVGNVVSNVNSGSEDSGAIYLLGRSHADQRSRISGNLIDGTGAGGDAHTIGIYLDDSTSGVAVTFNVVRHVGTHAMEVHGGDDVSIHDNVFDLRGGAATAILFQKAPADTHPANTMRGNTVQRNLVLMEGAARQPYTFLDGGSPLIAGNLYVVPPTWPAMVAQQDEAPVFAATEEEGQRAGDAARRAARASTRKALDASDGVGACYVSAR